MNPPGGNSDKTGDINETQSEEKGPTEEKEEEGGDLRNSIQEEKSKDGPFSEPNHSPSGTPNMTQQDADLTNIKECVAK